MKDMIEKFLCPGCIQGSAGHCDKYELEGMPQSGHYCGNWCAGTIMSGVGSIVLGLPKGFNRLGSMYFAKHSAAEEGQKTAIVRLFERDEYDQMINEPSDCEVPSSHLNVPVWAMEDDGYLFVRTFAPRIGWHWIDVVKGGTLDMVPTALNVGEFYDEID